jgi:hypothetical protein
MGFDSPFSQCSPARCTSDSARRTGHYRVLIASPVRVGQGNPKTGAPGGQGRRRRAALAAGPPRLLVASQPSNGSVDSVHYLFRADGARYAGPPSDRTEAERIEWIPLASIPGLIDRGAIVSGPTLIALLYLLMQREPPGRVPRRG